MDAPLSAPTLVPARAAGPSTPASTRACRPPTWAAPRAPPPPSTQVRRAEPNICLRLRAFLPRGKVTPLLIGQRVDDDPHRPELQPRDLGVDLHRHVVHLLAELAGVLSDVLGAQR